MSIAGLHFITGFGMLVGSIVMASLENTKVKILHSNMWFELKSSFQ